MNRLFVVTTATLTAIIGVLLGMLLTMPRATAPPSDPARAAAAAPAAVAESPGVTASAPPTSINFADIAERLNPAVVNIDATARARRARKLIEEGTRRGGFDGF